MVLTGGGGKEAGIAVRFIAIEKSYINKGKQVFQCKANVSLVSLIIEIPIDPSGRISECPHAASQPARLSSLALWPA